MSQHDPFKLVDALQAGGVQVVIAGGHAVNFHGFLRATEDIDLVFRREAGVDERLFQVLREWDAYWISDDIDSNTGLEITVPVSLKYIRSHRLLMLGTSAGYVDLFDFIPGLPDASVDDLYLTAEVSQGRRFASLQWLKKMKRAAGRPQDQIDLEHLP